MNRIGQQLGNYRLVNLLGQGGFADVYLGEHLHLGTRAAIKILQTRLVGSNLDQFRQEARTVARLIHPNIVRVLDFGIEGDVPFLIMDYARHGAISQRHPPGTRVLPATITPYINQIAAGLQYAHDQKFIHRDIKPENILLDGSNHILLSDFGLVLMTSSSSLKIHEFAGTVSYMAPEQLQGKPRAASDQYALGVVVYQWLCGQTPFTGSFAEIASQHLLIPPPSLREKVPGLPLELEKVVFTALAKDPQERFSSVMAFAEAFANVSGTIDPATMLQAPEEPAEPLITNLSTIEGLKAAAPLAGQIESGATLHEQTEEEAYSVQQFGPDLPINPLQTATSPDSQAETTPDEQTEAAPEPAIEQQATTINQADINAAAGPPRAENKLQSDERPTIPIQKNEQPNEADTLPDELATIPIQEEDRADEADTIASGAEDYQTTPAASPADQGITLPGDTQLPEATSLETTLPEENQPEHQGKPRANQPEADIAQEQTDLIHDPDYIIDPTEGPTVTMTDLQLDEESARAGKASAISEHSTIHINPPMSKRDTLYTTNNTQPSSPPRRQVSYQSLPPTEPDLAHVAQPPAVPLSSMSTEPERSPRHSKPSHKARTYDYKNRSGVQPPLQTLHPCVVPEPPFVAAPYRRKPARKQKSNKPVIILLLLLIILTAGGTTFFYFAPGKVQAVFQQVEGFFPAPRVTPTATPAGPTPKVTITLTSDSRQFQDTVNITAVTGNPDSTKNQVGAHMYSATSPNQGQTVTITTPTTIPGKQADGIVQLTNLTNNPISVTASTLFVSTGGIQISINQDTIVPALQSVTANAHAVNAGLSGNIPALDLDTCLNSGTPSSVADPTPGTSPTAGNQKSIPFQPQIPADLAKHDLPGSGCTGNGTIKNPVAFSGGQNDTTARVVQQRDIDNATQALNAALLPGVQKQLQAQVQPGESSTGDPKCQQKFTPDHAAGDQASSVTLKGTLTCTLETYDLRAAEILASQDLQSQIPSNGTGGGYHLNGQIATTLVDALSPDTNNAIKLTISSQGSWNYQISDSQKQTIIMSILGKSRQDAQNILNTQNGIITATISGGGDTLPADSSQILLVIAPAHP